MVKNIIIAVLVVLLITGIPVAVWASGVLSKTYANTATIVSAIPDIKIYNDVNVTVETTNITWGTVAKGQTYTKTFWLKNIGTVDLTNLNTTINLPMIYGGFDTTFSGGTTLVAGGIKQYILQFSPSNNAPNGLVDFNIVINGAYDN